MDDDPIPDVIALDEPLTCEAAHGSIRNVAKEYFETITNDLSVEVPLS